MLPATRNFCGIGMVAGALLLADALPARSQSAVTRDEIIEKLNKFESAPDIDVPALRQQVLERSKVRSKTDPPPNKRPLIAPDLTKLPTVNLEFQFDVDTPIVQPASYQTLGRLADALVHSSMLPYGVLIVGHTESNGRRENNVILSQRRADAIRDMLVNTFKIATKRVQSVGLGEEQFIDQARPTAPVNNQIQVVTLMKMPEPEPAKPAAPAAAKSAKKKK
ncbi:OmpA family protein [Bradyrhizobium lablabi]|nr:OmpA family protein [Bradyrhizobium lablabi]